MGVQGATGSQATSRKDPVGPQLKVQLALTRSMTVPSLIMTGILFLFG